MIEFWNYTNGRKLNVNKKQKVPNLYQIRDLNLKAQSHIVAGSFSSPRAWAALKAEAAAAVNESDKNSTLCSISVIISLL